MKQWAANKGIFFLELDLFNSKTWAAIVITSQKITGWYFFKVKATSLAVIKNLNYITDKIILHFNYVQFL